MYGLHYYLVSTHSRPKAAGVPVFITVQNIGVSTHSRPKAAVGLFFFASDNLQVSTHSRPKAAAHSTFLPQVQKQFQHTAARRRLQFLLLHWVWVYGFNTQPPEGGCQCRAWG